MDDEPGGEPEPDDERENHALIVGLRIALVTLVVIVGILLVGKILVAKLNLHGDNEPNGFVGGPVPVSPIPQPTSSPSASPTASSTVDSSLPTLSEPPAPTDIPPPEQAPPGLVLKISPTSVRSGQAFNISGTYAGRDGVQLQLQRLENGIWADYPNDISVSMGTYSTTAESTMTGTNSFRVYDQTANRASNVVSVLVR
ncbi:MAG: hypothetical protein ACTHJM_02310 [Marmoricola sp.]